LVAGVRTTGRELDLKHFYDTPLTGTEHVPAGALVGIVIVHGLAEHRGRYAGAMDHLIKAGFACFSFDMRGHGESPGRRGDIESFGLFVEDLDAIVRGITQAHPELTLFLWGHSMGSIVVANYAIDAAEQVRGAVTTACPLSVFSPLQHAISPVARLLSSALPTLRIPARLHPADLSHLKSVQDAYRDDPLVYQSITLRLATELLRATVAVREQAGTIDLPWLAVHGESDVIAPADGSSTLIQLLGSTDKELIVLPGRKHEVHNEPPMDDGDFFDRCIAWIRQRSELAAPEHQLSESARQQLLRTS